MSSMYYRLLKPKIAVSHKTIKELFKLTNVEASLAVLLTSGASLDDAAKEMNITKDTARSQIRSVFSKTDTHRQAELAILLLHTA